MCFWITDKTDEMTEKMKARQEPITAFKVLMHITRKSGTILCSPFYYNYEWKKGVNESNRPKKSLSDKEQRDQRIEKGFHFFKSRKQAHIKAQQYTWMGDTSVFKCNIDPKDVVATNKSELVATKATLIGEVQ